MRDEKVKNKKVEKTKSSYRPKDFKVSGGIYISEADRKIVEEYAKNSEYTRGLIISGQ